MADTITLETDTGAGHVFHVNPIGTNYKKEPGVYAFAREDDDGWAIIYIGETDNLWRRLSDELANHHRIGCVMGQNATHLFVRIVKGGNQARVDLETGLRRQYSPHCNQQ